MKNPILTFVFICFSIYCFSQTNIWQGDVTSNWHYSANWSLNHIPTTAEDVIIPDVAGFNPIVYGDAHCNNLTINSGAHLDVANTISVGGDYDNNAGSLTEINQITFNGDDIQNVYSLDCETLILDKPDGELRFPSETSSCNNYDWEQGLYRVNGGTFVINDLVDDGIFGTISITDGQLDIHQDTDQYIDLNCTLFMTGGECNIYGGEDDSFWSYAGNTSITMYDGILRFLDNGVKVDSSTFTFVENISGGEIETTGDFIVERTNYNPTGGLLLLIGPNDCTIQHGAGSNLFSVYLEKDSKGYNPKNYQRKHRVAKTNNPSKNFQVIAGSSLDINGIFGYSAGTFTPFDTMRVAGRWQTPPLPTYDGFNEGTSTVIFDGDEEAYILFNETFYNVIIDKSCEATRGFYIGGIGSITTINDLTILDGSMEMPNITFLFVGNNLLIESGAGLYISSSTDPVINVGGNWQNNNTSFSSLHGFSPGISVVSFNGTSDQTIHSNCPDGDFGSVLINSTSTVSAETDLHILNDFKIDNGIFNAPAELYVGGNWFNNDGEGAFNEGTSEVVFDGDEMAHINHSETFYNLTINKTYGSTGAFQIGAPSGITVIVINDLDILDGSLTIFSYDNLTVGNDVLIETDAGLCVHTPSAEVEIEIGGNWQNNNTSFSELIGFSPGQSWVEFIGTSNQNIISNCSDGDFYNLKINSSASVQSANNLHILGGVRISGGVFLAPPEIYVGGMWSNGVGEAGFDEGTGLVVFNGSSDAFCFSEEFYHMEINKPGATLKIGAILGNVSVYCVDLDWTAGEYEVQEGSTFIVDDLVDDGIYGDITVENGAILSLTQGTGFNEYLDLNGNLTIDGGEVHVYGGADNSYWTWNGDASITMTNDAGLYFEDVGIHIVEKEPFTFSENITGGEIHTAYNFIVSRDNFTPTAGHLYMDGPDDATLNIVAGSYLSSLDINKSAKKGGTKSYKKSPRDLKYQSSSKSNNVACISDIFIHGDFTIHNGSFSAPSEMRVRRDWVNHAGEGAFIENTGLVTFFGAVDSEIKYDEVFYNLNNEKDFDVRFLRTAENLNINIINDLHLNQGVFFTETGNTVEIGNTVEFLEEASWWAGNATISIAGDWYNHSTAPGVYSGFRAQNSTVTFNGIEDQYLTCDYDIEEFNNLVINNTGGMGDESLAPITNIRVNNDLTIIDGNWYDSPPDNVHEFYGDINISADGRFTDVYGIIILMGDAPQSLINNGIGNFDVIMFNKDNPTDQVNLEGNLIFKFLNINTGDVYMANHNYSNNAGIFIQADASLNLEAGADLDSDPDAVITVYAGGKIAFNGSPAENCVVTCDGGTGHYYFNIEGEIAAEYTHFSDMSADGISVLPAGSVDPLHAFNNCLFSNGESGGAYLAVNSDQNLICDGATFLSNIWGGANNVRKITDVGEITFTNYSGDFSGEDYDFDPFDRIHWDDGSREIDLTAMLEGPFNSGVMKTSLNDKNLLPPAQPYNISPWNYTGTESVPNMPNPDIVDWILIEYRDAFDANSAIPATMVAQEAAFLLNDGSIVGLDGSSILSFNHSINQSLFVVIYHRNHLGIMSSMPVTELCGIYNYDFTTGPGQAYNGGQINLGSGIYGMYGGDGDADGTINMVDKTTVWSIETGTGGYLDGDFNMDSQTDNSDKNEIWINNTGNSSQIPD